MGLLIDGKYYPDKTASGVRRPSAAIAKQYDVYNKSSQCAKYDREIIQPYTPDGKPNPDFIKHYPEESRQYGFIKDDK